MRALALIAFGLLLSAPALAQDAGAPQPPMASDSVARAVFTTNVADREPVDQITSLQNDVQQVYFFTELMGLQGQTVTHQWVHAGEVKAEVSFEVGGPRWRVWSTKKLDPTWTGEWTVSVVDASGATLRQATLSYEASGQ